MDTRCPLLPPAGRSVVRGDRSSTAIEGPGTMRTMAIERLILVDRTPRMAAAWRDAFAEDNRVEVHEDDYFVHSADAMVSPANSFGIMDGGLDLAIRNELGLRVQQRVQRRIVEAHHGELPVGAAEIVSTDDVRWPWLIAAPTMRAPELVGNTLNAYLALRAALLAIRQHPQTIRSVVCCGLGTGIGGMDPVRCATQMFLALRHVDGPARIPSFEQIHAIHRALRSS